MPNVIGHQKENAMHRKTAIVLILAGLFLFPSRPFADGSTATGCIDYGNYMHWVGGVRTPGDAVAVAVEGRFAYVLNRKHSLQIVDLTVPEHPVIVARVEIPGSLQDIAIEDGYAYIADLGFGLHVIDIADPNGPLIVGSWQMPEEEGAVAVSGNYAYVGGWGALRVVDFTNKESPTAAGSVYIPGMVRGIALFGDFAYLAVDDLSGSGDNGLKVVDITNPENPVVIGGVDTPGKGFDVAVLGSYAYLADFHSGLHVIDVSNPSIPWIVGTIDLPRASARGVAVVGRHAYVSAGSELFAIDISNPASPEIVGMIDTPHTAWDVTVSDNYAYVADGFGSFGGDLHVFDITNSTSVGIVGGVDTPSYCYDVDVDGSYAYSIDMWEGIRVVDVADPENPEIVGSVDTPGLAFRVTVEGGYAYVVDGPAGLQIIDITNPRSPRIVGSVDPPNNARVVAAVAVLGNYAYITVDDSMHVIDISNAEDPRIVGSMETLGGAGSVDIVGSYAYVIKYSPTGLLVVDVADPESPLIVGNLNMPGNSAKDICVVGNYAYLTDPANSLEEGDETYLIVIDVSDPESPRIVGRVSLSESAGRVDVAGNFAYVTNGRSGLQVIDISNPESPLIVGSVGTPYPATNAFGVRVEGEYAYIANGDSGLVIVPAQCGTKPITAHLDIKPGSCPNPLNTNAPNSDNANGGVLSAAVLGSNAFDVHDIDVSSLELEGTAPLRHKYKDVAAPPVEESACACSEAGPDGYADLTLKFARLDVVAGFGKVSGRNVTLMLTGRLIDGTEIELSDCVKIVPKKGNEGPRYNSSNESLITKLEQATPNPFNPVTHIRYQLEEQGYTTLKVYDVAGRLVATLVNGEMPGGLHEATWDAKGMPSGVYFYRLTKGSFSETRKMVLLK
jgi:hypothetical protein